MQVWVTRAEPGASATAGRLRAQGHAPLVAPLLEVRRLGPPAVFPNSIGAVAFTSAHGVQAFAAWIAERRWPVFTVGDATAAAARQAGFAEVTSAEGDVAALAARIAATPFEGVVLHAGARERAGDLEGLLVPSGRPVATVPLYETLALKGLPGAVGAALGRGDLEAVLVHSPKAGRALAVILADRPAVERARLRAVGLSPACLEPLAKLQLGALDAAAEPTEAALLERLG